MSDVIKPGPPGGGSDEDGQEQEEAPVMDVMGTGRDFPLQVCLHNQRHPVLLRATAVFTHSMLAAAS